MAKIAVYSTNPYGMELMCGYIGDAEKKYGLRDEVVSYDSEDILMWDAESVGMFDLVVVYRDWQAAAAFRKRFKEMDIVMVALGMSRRLYDVQPCYQIYEPAGREDFMRVFMAALNGKQSSRCFVFQTGWVRYRLNVHEIMYFESDKRVIRIKGLYGDYSFYGSMRELSEQIKELCTIFVRVHSSFVINTEYVRSYSSRQIVMLDGTCISVNDKWRQDVVCNCGNREMASIRHISTVLC